MTGRRLIWTSGTMSGSPGCTPRRLDNATTGRIYQDVIARERRGDYLRRHRSGDPPHHRRDQGEVILRETDAFDFVLVEIGGTVGDIEEPPLPRSHPPDRERAGGGAGDVRASHVGALYSLGRGIKTKPTQHSVKELQSVGIQPDMLLCRCERPIPDSERRKIALFCNVRAAGR